MVLNTKKPSIYNFSFPSYSISEKIAVFKEISATTEKIKGYTMKRKEILYITTDVYSQYNFKNQPNLSKLTSHDIPLTPR